MAATRWPRSRPRSARRASCSTWAEPSTPGLVAADNECLGWGRTNGSSSNIRQASGADNTNPFAGSCAFLPANYVASTDVLVVRRLAVQPVADGSCSSARCFAPPYGRGRCIARRRAVVIPSFTRFRRRPLAKLPGADLRVLHQPVSDVVPALYRCPRCRPADRWCANWGQRIEQIRVRYGDDPTQYFGTLTGVLRRFAQQRPGTKSPCAHLGAQFDPRAGLREQPDLPDGQPGPTRSTTTSRRQLCVHHRGAAAPLSFRRQTRRGPFPAATPARPGATLVIADHPGADHDHQGHRGEHLNTSSEAGGQPAVRGRRSTPGRR